MKILSDVCFVGMKPSATSEQQIFAALAELDPLCGRLLTAQVEIRAKNRRPMALYLRLVFADAITYVTAPIVEGRVVAALDSALLQSMRHYVSDRLHTENQYAIAA